MRLLMEAKGKAWAGHSWAVTGKGRLVADISTEVTEDEQTTFTPHAAASGKPPSIPTGGGSRARPSTAHAPPAPGSACRGMLGARRPIVSPATGRKRCRAWGCPPPGHGGIAENEALLLLPFSAPAALRERAHTAG